MKIKGIEGECYFHTVDSNRRLGYGDNRWVRIGRWMRGRNQFPGGWTYVTEPRHCAPAMHACKTITGIRTYSFPHQGRYISICQLRGKVAHQWNKSHALERRVLFIRRIKTFEDYKFAMFGGSSGQVAKWIMNPHLNAFKLGRTWKLVKRAKR